MPGPFDLDDTAAYSAWRERKLADHPRHLEDLIVEVGDPRNLTAAERAALADRVRRCNMAIYAGGTREDADKDIVIALGQAFGLTRLDHNPGADEDAVTSLQISDEARHTGYIPYSNRPIAWHTDGYYNAPDQAVLGMMLHCVHAAREGGENALLDQEIAYLWLRDENPDYIRALMAPDAMTIPANADEGGTVRPERSVPVFEVRPDGRLHMRYTRRKRNIVWKDDPLVTQAVAFLAGALESDSPLIFRARLEPGWGLVCNNVLHTRTAFSDDPDPARRRLLYRGRYYDRVAGT